MYNYLPSKFKSLISKAKRNENTELVSKLKRNIPKAKLLHTVSLDIKGGESFLPIAKRKLDQLRDEMYDNGMDIGNKEYQIGSARIIVESVNGFDTIRIRGGELYIFLALSVDNIGLLKLNIVKGSDGAEFNISKSNKDISKEIQVSIDNGRMLTAISNPQLKEYVLQVSDVYAPGISNYGRTLSDSIRIFGYGGWFYVLACIGTDLMFLPYINSNDGSGSSEVAFREPEGIESVSFKITKAEALIGDLDSIMIGRKWSSYDNKILDAYNITGHSDGSVTYIKNALGETEEIRPILESSTYKMAMIGKKFIYNGYLEPTTVEHSIPTVVYEELETLYYNSGGFLHESVSRNYFVQDRGIDIVTQENSIYVGNILISPDYHNATFIHSSNNPEEGDPIYGNFYENISDEIIGAAEYPPPEGHTKVIKDIRYPKFEIGTNIKGSFIYDYDFLDENIFILLYRNIIETTDTTFTSYDNNTITTNRISKYFLAYCIDGILTQIELPIMNTYDNIFTALEGNVYTNFSGNTITYFSCWVGNEAMLYTYVVEDITMSDIGQEGRMNEPENTNIHETITGRIIGIVNLSIVGIERGHIQEWTIDDSVDIETDKPMWNNYFNESFNYKFGKSIGLIK